MYTHNSTTYFRYFLLHEGVLDFAGGNVVHISAGVSAMMSAIIVGKRTGFGTTSSHPHNMVISLIGTDHISYIQTYIHMCTKVRS